MKEALVSVILPTYNRAHIIRGPLESVLNQTYSNLEIIIVDDGSTDETYELISSYTDSRICYIRQGTNNGVSSARNAGISRATGEYIAFQDSDDIWHPEKIAKQIEVFQKDPEIMFCYHKIQYDFGGNRYAVLPDEEIPTQNKNGSIYGQMLYGNLVPCPALMARKSIIEKAGFFDTSYPALEDYDYALRLSRIGQAGFIDEVLLYAGLTPGGVSDNSLNFLLAMCKLIGDYKQDFIKYNHLEHAVTTVLEGAEEIGCLDQFYSLLEKVVRL